MSCHFGFNKNALDAIERALADKDEEDKLVVLSFDEVKITPSLKFNLETLAFDEYVKLDDDPLLNRDELSTTAKDVEPRINSQPTLADNALVYMARPLKHNWVQPFAVSSFQWCRIWKRYL